MAFAISYPYLGVPPIGVVDAGKAVAGTVSTTLKPTIPLGTIVHGVDPALGEGEFIFLAGAPSIGVGELCVYDGTTFAAVRCTTAPNQARPVAVALAAVTTGTNWGFFQISGTAVVKKRTGVNFLAKVAVGVGSLGKLGATAAGVEIENMRTANTASVLSATTTVTVVMNRPHVQGRIN